MPRTPSLNSSNEISSERLLGAEHESCRRLIGRDQLALPLAVQSAAEKRTRFQPSWMFLLLVAVK